MQNPGLTPVLVIFLSISLFSAAQIHVQTVNGLPTCAVRLLQLRRPHSMSDHDANLETRKNAL